MERAPNRTLMNTILLLRLLQAADGVYGVTRLQKLVFTSEHRARSSKERVNFNYEFKRWHYGPYSRELASDLENLILNNLIVKNGNYLSITGSGNQVLNKTADLYEQSCFDDVLRDSIKRYNSMPLEWLLKDVYSRYGITTDYEMGDVILEEQ